MNVKRYFGPTARDALRQLKAELGADAIVLSNRSVEDGVEIIAMPADVVGAASPMIPPSAPLASRRPLNSANTAESFPPMEDAGDDYRISLNSQRRALHTPQAAAEAPLHEPRRNPLARAFADKSVVRAFEPPRVETADFLMNQAPYPDGIEISRPRRCETEAARKENEGAESERSARQRAAQNAERAAALAAEQEREREAALRRSREEEARIQALQEANAKLMEELGGIRNMIERQLAGFAWGEARKNAPARAEIMGDLLEAGFSASLARQLSEKVPENATPEQARGQVKRMLARGMRAMTAENDIIDQGGVYALVGPTGVGKTTTTAKIAARFVVRHGAERLAMITTDGYRIGAQEQLRIYGRILGVPVFPVRDAAELRQTLAELRHKQMVLIDTVGMSQRDRMVAQQAAMLSGAGSVKRLLLLNATARGDTLDDVIKVYRGPDLAGCILSKVDETASLAPALGAAVDHQLDICYVTNGQRVPEDLHLPNRAYLLHRALRSSGEHSPWRLRDDEAALMMAAGMER